MTDCRRIAIPPGEPIDFSRRDSLDAHAIRSVTGFNPQRIVRLQPSEPTGERDEYTGVWISYGGYGARMCGGWYNLGLEAYARGERQPPTQFHRTAREWWAAGNRAAAIEAGRRRRTR